MGPIPNKSRANHNGVSRRNIFEEPTKEAITKQIVTYHKFINGYMKKLSESAYNLNMRKLGAYLNLFGKDIDECCYKSILLVNNVALDSTMVEKNKPNDIIPEEIKKQCRMFYATASLSSELMADLYGQSANPGVKYFSDEIDSDVRMMCFNLFGEGGSYGLNEITDELKLLVADWYNFEK